MVVEIKGEGETSVSSGTHLKKGRDRTEGFISQSKKRKRGF